MHVPPARHRAFEQRETGVLQTAVGIEQLRSGDSDRGVGRERCEQHGDRTGRDKRVVVQKEEDLAATHGRARIAGGGEAPVPRAKQRRERALRRGPGRRDAVGRAVVHDDDVGQDVRGGRGPQRLHAGLGERPIVVLRDDDGNAHQTPRPLTSPTVSTTFSITVKVASAVRSQVIAAARSRPRSRSWAVSAGRSSRDMTASAKPVSS